MFMLWGSGGDASALQSLGERECPVCGRLTTFTAKLYYRYAHIWYLCGWVTRRAYMEECDHCGNGATLDTAEARKLYPKDHIPFLRKRGWALCLTVIAALIGFAAASSRTHNAEVAAYLASPEVHDLYLADLAKVPNSGFATDDSGVRREHAYGAMKVMQVSKDKVVFVTTTEAYDKKSGITKIVKNARYQLEYDIDGIFALSGEEVATLRDQGVIFDIIR